MTSPLFGRHLIHCVPEADTVPAVALPRQICPDVLIQSVCPDVLIQSVCPDVLIQSVCPDAGAAAGSV